MPRTAEQHASLPYRPAIDGLRAFAVLSVIAYHVHPAALPGGWFGVDVFFVISGFLITSLLLSEYKRRRGRIDLLGFWLARARRLLPALFLVLAAVLVATPFLTARGRIGNVAGDVLATLAYVANWRFVVGDEAYFGQIASPSPLRHAWSLAVEEQFYIVYPLLLIALLALIRSRRTLALVLIAIAGVSALLMAVLHHPGLEPSRVYYGTDTRAHQLLVGAAVATVMASGPGEVGRRYVRSIDRWCRRLALPALLVVLSAFWWAGAAQSALFEGGLVPLSLLIAVVLVAATSPSVSWPQRLLALEPLRRIGLVSYGLYLWHWPVIVYLNDRVLPLPEWQRAVIQVGLSGLLAFLSYRFVERPIRKQGLGALVPRVPAIGKVVAWATVPLLVAGSFAMPSAARTIDETTGSNSGEIAVPETSYRPGSRMTSVMFIGNSIPKSLISTFRSSDHPDLELIDHTNVGCGSLGSARVSDGKRMPELEECPEWRKGWAESISTQEPDVVVYFTAQSLVSDRAVGKDVVEFGSKKWVTLLEEHLDETKRAARGRQFAVMNLACHDIPTFGSEEIERVDDVEYVKELNKAVGRWAEREDVPVIDQYSLLCPGDEYHDTIDGVPLYADGLHFTGESGPIFWTWLAPRIQRVAEGRELS